METHRYSLLYKDSIVERYNSLPRSYFFGRKYITLFYLGKQEISLLYKYLYTAQTFQASSLIARTTTRRYETAEYLPCDFPLLLHFVIWVIALLGANSNFRSGLCVRLNQSQITLDFWRMLHFWKIPSYLEVEWAKTIKVKCRERQILQNRSKRS